MERVAFVVRMPIKEAFQAGGKNFEKKEKVTSEVGSMAPRLNNFL